MATAIDYPLTLPKLFQKESFTEAKQGNLLRTEMDSGLPKVRRIFTAVSRYFRGVMIYTQAELDIFEAFFDNTIYSGALTFNFPNPYDFGATTLEVRFNLDTRAEPYKITPHGETLDWEVQLSLETIP